LFFTSPEAALELSSRIGEQGVALICDPWLERAEIDKAAARRALGIQSGSRVFLHTGTSRPEKGLKDVCEAIQSLDHKVRGNACLLRAGVVDPLDAASLRALEAVGGAVIMDQYVSEDELAMCYVAADWVLLPYRDQKETSGVLVHAAANRRPVIASDYGLIGSNVLAYGLGRLFAHRDKNALRSLLADIIADPDAASFDVSGMDEFSNLSSPDAFRNTLNDHWLLDPPDFYEG
jgi:glycosyltransferase involved in cell wall biosynthesis